MKFLIFVQGGTNVGKSTFLNSVKNSYPDDVHLVEVGKALRAKYPPEYFEGQAAPAKTQEEAITLVLEGIKEGEQQSKTVILIDGQPRDIEQAKVLSQDSICSLSRTRLVIELVCPRELRVERAKRRDSDPSKLALSLERIDRDILNLHEVSMAFTRYKRYRFDTSLPNYTPLGKLNLILTYHGIEDINNNPVSIAKNTAGAQQSG